MVTIRLSRGGAKKRPFYSILVADQRRQTRGRFIERVGFYNPIAAGREVKLRLDTARVDHWVSRGAQPSARVNQLYNRAKAEQAAEQSKAAARAAAKAAADAEKAAKAAEAAKIAEATEAAKAAEAKAEKAAAAEPAKVAESAKVADSAESTNAESADSTESKASA